MNERWRVRLAGVVAVAAVAATLATLTLAADGPDFLASVVVGIWLLVVSVVGGIVGIKRPGHTIGWLLLATGAFIAVALFTREYAIRALEDSSRSLPAGEIAGWLSSWLPFPGFVAYGLVLILFPSGRPRSQISRLVVVIAVGAGATVTASVALAPGPIDGLRVGANSTVRNPFGMEGAGEALLQVFQASGSVLLLLGIFGVIARLIGFRKTTGLERQQLKWFILTIGLLLLGLVTNLLTTSTVNEEDVAYHVLAFFVPMLAVLSIPVAMGVAILRYRLYDIDVIINRTLVYGALTAALAGSYGVIVTVAGTLFEGSSDVVTAGATLSVAALFQPFRARIQRFIDRRFYRERYDAARTVEMFSSRLREEVDLDSMRTDLVVAVQETVQPRRVSVWLKG